MKEIVLVLLCFLLGSIPFSYIFSRLWGGVDIRAQGTGNVGATNVLRTLGIKIALASLTGDILKGFAAAWLGMHFGGVSLAAACGAAALAGHCWPVFLRFRGGKGVATGAGAVIYLLPLEALILLVVFLIIVYFSRFVSLGSICVAAALPIVTFIMQNPWQYVIMSLFFAIIVIFRHRSNIERLRNGTEKKLNEKDI